MQKLKMHSADGVARNIEKIGELFPNAVTEVLRGGKVERAVDFDVLRQELSDVIVEGREERYQFTWPGKNEAKLRANLPISAALRPVDAESVGRDGTPGGFDSENLYIEGDNLEVLKLLRETYLGKVKMIYIDPPYNTGGDFIYNDKFAAEKGEYMANSGQFDAEGNRMEKNLESNGRFHSDWCSMIYPRLKVAKDLLADDGVIFISIDDNEISNTRKICDEIFGEANFVSCITWQKIHSTKNDAKYFSENHEYAVIYAKAIATIGLNLLPRTEEMDRRYQNPDNDPRGNWQSGDLVASGERSNGHYIVTSPQTGKTFDVPQGKHWVYSQENLMAMIADNRIWFGESGNSFPRKKRFLTEVQHGKTPNTLWLSDEVGHNQTASREVKALFDNKKFFDFPKPVSYIKQMIQIATFSNDIVLDFFSGSATTAHAVMQLNAEDGGKRKFIMVQLPEACAENSEAFKAGYKNVCEIGKERIRRAGKKIKEESPLTTQDIDVGFRCLRLDTSNMKDVYYRPDELRQEDLFAAVDNVKEGRGPEDLLFQAMLELGAELSAKIETAEIAGKKVFNVADNYLLACFDMEVTDETVAAMAKMKPQYAVLRDNSMKSDSVAVNFEQIFKTYSPDTTLRVL